MTEEEKEAIEILRFSPIFRGRKPENDCLEIVLNLIGKLQKELEEKTTILMAGADKVKQLEKENHQLIDEKIDQIFKGVEEEVLEEMREEVRTLREENQRIKDINVELNTDVSAWKTTAKELEEEIREFIKKELPDDEIMECCSNYDVNGVAIRKELEKILANKE